MAKIGAVGLRGGRGGGAENGYFEQNEHFHVIFFTINMQFLKKK